MGRYATREDEVDRLLRGGVLVDLFRVVRQGIRASVESYSIKRLEPHVRLRARGGPAGRRHSHRRVRGVAGAGRPRRRGRRGDPASRSRRYNRDDVVSTWKLRDWLEARRPGARASSSASDLPAARAGERRERARNLAEWLAAGPGGRRTARRPAPPDEPDGRRRAEQRAAGCSRSSSAGIGARHKAFWWRFYQLLGMTDEERRRGARAARDARARRPGRTTAGRAVPLPLPGPGARHRGGQRDVSRPGRRRRPSTGHADDRRGRTRSCSAASRASDDRSSPRSLVPVRLRRRPTQQEQSLLRVGRWVVEHGIDGRRAVPGRTRPAPARRTRVSARHRARALREPATRPRRCRRAGSCSRSIDARCPIQGPPGSGKTYTGARMIVDLVHAGKRVGVTANSHKVIGNLLDAVATRPPRTGVRRPRVRVGQKPGDGRGADVRRRPVAYKDNDDGAARARRRRRSTSSAARPGSGPARSSRRLVDVLFVDEAGQFSLANAVAVSHRPRERSCCWATRSSSTSRLRGPTRRAPSGARSRTCWIGGDSTHAPGARACSSSARGGCTRTSARTRPRCSTRASCEPERGQERQALAGRRAGRRGRHPVVPVDHARATTPTRSRRRAPSRPSSASCSARARVDDRDGADAPIRPTDILVVAPVQRPASSSSSEHLAERGGYPGGPGRHRGQVPGPGGADLDLRHGQLARRRRRRAAWSSSTR